jgi:hypothetical protein
MNATEIVTNFDACPSVFSGPPNAWLKLLRILSAGEQGVALRDLRPGTRASTPSKADDANRQMVMRWETAGLVTMLQEDPPKGQGGRPRWRIWATSKAKKLLRVTAIR